MERMYAVTTTTASFAESIVQSYDDHLVPLIFEDFARDLAGLVSVPAGGAVLETAAGTGVLTRHLAHALGGAATVVASDVNPAMLRQAETRLSGSENVSFRIADGLDLPFDDESFDAVACQFGVMFFEDHVRGYREALRVLRDGGTFVFNVWDSLARNRLARLVHETVVNLFPADPPVFLSVPFGYHDLRVIRGELEEAGFGRINVSVNPGVSRAPSVRAVVQGLVSGSPLGAALAERGVAEEATRAVEAALTRKLGPGPVAAPMQSISFVAHRD